MPDPAQVNRSVSTIRTELEYLRDAGILQPSQLMSIMAQLPQNGQTSQYADMKFTPGAQQQQQQQTVPQFQQIAQEAQNPQNPAHPDHPKHNEWARNLAGKFGNAMVWGAGSTFGGDMVNDALKHF